MAFDKKSSMYSDRGASGPAEELDTYGVWVKSEPQDLIVGLAGADDFDAEAVPYETGFNSDFDGFDDIETEIPALDIEGGGFDDGITADFGQASPEASNELLLKIAGELSLLRTELNTLKKEFADIRAGSGAAPDASDGSFFAEEEDEKIALTSDEMDNFLASTDFSGDEGFDTQREADEAALKELSEQNEAESPAEDTAIDFDNLGIDLDNESEEAVLEELSFDEVPAAEVDDDFEVPSFDSLSFDNDTPSEDDLAAEPPLEDALAAEPSQEMDELSQEAELQDFAAEQSEEIEELRQEGAEPHTPAPDNSEYLESDPFVLDSSDFGDMSLDTLSESTLMEDTASEELSTDEISADLSLDDDSFDMSLDDFSSEDTLSLEEETTEEQSLETAESVEPAEEQTIDTDLSAGLEDISLEESVLSEDIFAGDASLDDFGTGLALDDETLAESGLVEEPAADDLALGEDIDLNDETLAESGLVEEPAADDLALGEDIDLNDETFAESGLVEEPAADDLALGEDIDLNDETLAESGLVEEPAADDLEAGDLALDDETLAESGLVEEPAADDLEAGDLALSDETFGEDLSFSDDLSLDDFGTSVELDENIELGAQDDGIIGLSDEDDSLAQVIPEALEVNAEEAAVSLDDDLEALGDDLSVEGESGLLETAEAAGSGEELGIPAGLKSDLKNVLSYMDHLLESLPEDKIEEFAKSEYFDAYKKIFKELGLV